MLTYLGPDHVTARWAEERARALGFSPYQARAVGHVASFRDGYIFRSTIATREGCSVRTVQRGFTRAKREGLMGIWRASRNEIPPGAKGPVPCGWSHRITIGRGLSGEAMKAAVAKAKLAALTRTLARGSRPADTRGVPHAPQPQRGLTPEQRARLLELEAEERAELEALAAAAIAATEARSRAGPGNHN